MKEVRAFTGSADRLVNQLVSEVGISFPHSPEDGLEINKVVIKKFRAIWDTGATTSVITNKVVQELNLKPIGKTPVQGVTGRAISNRFLINFYLPNKVIIPYVSVTESQGLAGNFDILIGMDIINLGDFVVTNYDNKTKFSFRMPSIEEIDFVRNMQSIRHNKIGRNDPCPCGSGFKYKKCHGK